MTRLRIWLSAIRPKTLGLAFSPVFVGTALAYAENREFSWATALAALVAALCIQIGTNLHNDAADFRSGADTAGRLGPPRVSAQGWLAAASVERAAGMAFALAFLSGIYLVWVGGVPILILGILALLAGTAYSAGPWPISHSPLGECFVWLFFGVVAVSGSYYLQSLHWSRNALLSGCGLGMLAAAVLVVNNYRDHEADRRSGRNTLGVLLPLWASRLEYSILLLGGMGVLYWVRMQDVLLWWPWLLSPLALWLVWRIYRLPVGSELNSLLAHTAQFQLVFAVVLSLHSLFLVNLH